MIADLSTTTSKVLTVCLFSCLSDIEYQNRGKIKPATAKKKKTQSCEKSYFSVTFRQIKKA